MTLITMEIFRYLHLIREIARITLVKFRIHCKKSQALLIGPNNQNSKDKLIPVLK